MSGARLTAALECANDAGVRFTLRRPGDSHGASRLSAGAAASCASVDRPASAVRAAPSEAVATPRPEGLVRAWGRARFHTPVPAPWGVAPGPMIPSGKATGHRTECGGSTGRAGVRVSTVAGQVRCLVVHGPVSVLKQVGVPLGHLFGC